jgi:hypothetical protein
MVEIFSLMVFFLSKSYIIVNSMININVTYAFKAKANLDAIDNPMHCNGRLDVS